MDSTLNESGRSINHGTGCVNGLPYILMLAFDLPKLVIKAVDKIRKGFFGKVRKKLMGAIV
jgi:hypothetical protein